jgi:membrane associated rhomboid family serine protease
MSSEHEHIEFLRAVWERKTPFTFIFLAVNIAMFLLMEYAGSTTDPGTLMTFGVKSNPEINQGEWWRLIMPIFIHIGPLHLFFNSYALWMVGQQVEKLYGSPKFVLLYLATGVAGVLGSYYYNPGTISAGASGAIMGLFGVLFAFGFRYRHSIPPFFKKAVGTGVLPVIVINLIIGFTIPQIDNSAHIAGLVCGALLAAVIPYMMPGAETSSPFKAIQALSLAMVLASFYTVAANYHGSPQGFIDTLNNAQSAFGESTQALSEGKTGDLAALQAQVASAIDQLRDIPSLDVKVDALSADLLKLMEDQYALLQDVAKSGTMTFPHARRLKEHSRRYSEVMEALSEWAGDEGRRYGIQMGKRP